MLNKSSREDESEFQQLTMFLLHQQNHSYHNRERLYYSRETATAVETNTNSKFSHDDRLCCTMENVNRFQLTEQPIVSDCLPQLLSLSDNHAGGLTI